MTNRRPALAGAGALLVAFLVLALLVAGGRSPDRPDLWVAEHAFHLAEQHRAVAVAAGWVAALAEPWCLRGVAVAWALWLWLRRGRGPAGAWLVATMLLGGTLAVLTKLLYARPRPVWPDPITVAAGYSYPSGHATSAALFAGCALVVLMPGRGPAGRRLLVAVALGLTLLVGLDRLVLGVHYLSDVVGGYLLGSAVVLAMLGLAPGVAASPAARVAAATQRGDHA